MIKLLRHVFFDDFPLKLFSLGLALLVWITVSFAIEQKEASPNSNHARTSEVQTSFHLPVMVIASNGDPGSFKASPNRVQVAVRGEPRIVQSLQATDIRALVDVTGMDAAHAAHMPVEISLPTGITLVSVLPKDVQVTLP
jgi:YbbR domain-containing protein